jgi:hypothetical protein
VVILVGIEGRKLAAFVKRFAADVKVRRGLGPDVPDRFDAGGRLLLSRPDGSDESGGRYRIRTYDFHRVKMALYR